MPTCDVDLIDRHRFDELHNTFDSVVPLVNSPSVRISLETVDALKRIPGLAGIHIMTVSWEQSIPKIVEESGLLPRPVFQ